MFTTEETFRAHTEEIHKQEYNIQRSDSITKSPPNKRVKGPQDENMDVEELDIMKQKDGKITELELKINQLEQKLIGIEENNRISAKPAEIVSPVGSKLVVGPIPNHLSPVHDQHLHDLNGIRMKADGNPGGDCLSSCTTMHISYTKDNAERKRVNRKINNHIADGFDSFYKNKISLPYSETVGGLPATPGKNCWSSSGQKTPSAHIQIIKNF